MTSGTINDSTKTYTWTLNFFWVLVPLMVAGRIWEFEGALAFSYVCSILITFVYGIITSFRAIDYFDYRPFDIWTRKTLWSFVQGGALGAAMIFAWSDSWLGPLYLIFVFVNFCLIIVEWRRSKT